MSKVLKLLFAMTFVLRFLLRLLSGMTVKRVLIVIAVLLLGVLTFNTVVIALVWNVIGIHSVLGAGTLSLAQCVVVGALLMCLGV
jgi:hypothetical protein